MERQCNLLYYMGLAVGDQQEMPLPELEWMHGWLVKTKNDENEAMKK